ENLKKSLSDDRQKQAFRLGVDKCDKEVLSIDELNKAIPDVDETALPQVVMSITAQVRLGKSVNGIPPLPSTFVPRDDVATIAAMLQSTAPSQSNRTVVIHGWQGEGKRSTAQAVGHWMYEHVGVDSTYWVDLKHAGTKEDVQRFSSGDLWGLLLLCLTRSGWEALDTVPGLRLVLAVQEGADVITQLNQLSSTPATHQLRQLPLAAAAQVLQNHLVSEGLKLSQADAELVAGNHGCNPRALALISPLDDASRTALLVLSDTMPLEFDISMAKQPAGLLGY
ncbi:hypothetical protein HaLaN_11225, partial [Haematococcus lacustris]